MQTKPKPYFRMTGPRNLIDLTTTRARDAITARYMQTKARAAGTATRWVTDAENAGRTFV